MLFTNADSIIIVNLSSCESHCSRPVEVSSEKKYLNIFGSFLFSFSYNCAEITSALLRNTGPGFWPSYLITPSSVPWKCAYWNNLWKNIVNFNLYRTPQSPVQRPAPRVCQSYWGCPERLTLRTSRTGHRGTEGRWGKRPWGRLCKRVAQMWFFCVCVGVTFWRVCPPLCWSEAGRWELHRCWSLQWPLYYVNIFSSEDFRGKYLSEYI